MKSKIIRLSGPVDADSTSKENPSLADVVEAVDALDGKACTMLVLWSDTDTYRMVVGGGLYRFICYITNDELSFKYLRNEKARGEKIALVAGGQLGEFDDALCVDKDAVLQACRFFFDTGKCDPGLPWLSK